MTCQKQIDEHFKTYYFWDIDKSGQLYEFLVGQWTPFVEEQEVKKRILSSVNSLAFRRTIKNFVEYQIEDDSEEELQGYINENNGVHPLSDEQILEMQQSMIKEIESDIDYYFSPIFVYDFKPDEATSTTENGRFTKVPTLHLFDRTFENYLGYGSPYEIPEIVEDFIETLSNEIFCEFFFYCLVNLVKQGGL
jgi:hypothetical protein